MSNNHKWQQRVEQSFMQPSNATLAIGRFYTPDEIEQIKRNERENVVNTYRKIRERDSELINYLSQVTSEAAYRFSLAYSQCIGSVLFADSPTWHETVQTLRIAFNNAWDNLSDAIEFCKEHWKDETPKLYGVELEPPIAIDKMLDTAEQLGSELKDALTDALVHNRLDKLSNVHKRRSKDYMQEALREQSNQVNTAYLALQTRMEKATAYIGIQALRLQHEENVVRINDQWRLIWRRLNARQHTIQGVEKEALEHLNRLGANTANIRGEERLIDHEVDRYKGKVLRKELYTIPKSGDKVVTEHTEDEL